MKISATPITCSIHFDLKIGNTDYRAYLDQEIKEGMVSLSIRDMGGNLINNDVLEGIIKEYLLQKYSIIYEDRTEFEENDNSSEVRLDPPI